jgi:hypothetical protein
VVAHITMSGRQVGTFVGYGPDGPRRHSPARAGPSPPPRRTGSGSSMARSSSTGPTVTTWAPRHSSAGCRRRRCTRSG